MSRILVQARAGGGFGSQDRESVTRLRRRTVQAPSACHRFATGIVLVLVAAVFAFLRVSA
jgi:hypothetical protein